MGRDPAHLAHLGPGPGPFGPIWVRVPAHLAHLGLGPGPLGPFYILKMDIIWGMIQFIYWIRAVIRA